MTEQELREKIKTFLMDRYIRKGAWVEAYEATDQIIAFIKEAGYVKLADDQSLPENSYNRLACGGVKQYELNWMSDAYTEAQQKMLKAGWRKVEVKDGS